MILIANLGILLLFLIAVLTITAVGTREVEKKLNSESNKKLTNI